MNKIILALATTLALVSTFAEAETKKVCKDKTDKAGKIQKECKTVKVHKKLEGSKVEEAKKK
jgi:hypothetical protein